MQLEWLLSDSHPSVKYWALKDLLGKDEDDPQVQAVRKAIPQYEAVKRIFSHQTPEGYWGDPSRLWGYQNTGFQLLLLSELGMARDHRIEKAVDFLCRFQKEEGYFTIAKRPRLITTDFCLNAIFLKAFLLFGYTDSRVKNAVDFLVSTEGKWRCGFYPQEREKVFPSTCYMGGIKVLGAFAKLPPQMVTGEVRALMARQIEIYLENEIYYYRRGKKGERVKKPSWEKFTFPLYWQSDALEVMDVLTELGVKDERMKKAVALIRSKEVDGAWTLERSFLKDAYFQLEEVGEPSRWVTLRALRVLKRMG